MGYKLDTIVKEMLVDFGESNTNKYARFYNFAVGFLREMNIDTFGVPKTIELCMNDNDTADLPVDYMQYTLIGLCGKDGHVHSLGRNDKLCLKNCGVNSANNPNFANVPTSAFTFATIQELNSLGLASIEGQSQSWRNGEFMGKLFGVHGGNNDNGEFRIDTVNGIIQFGGLQQFCNTIIMEYITDINAIDGDFEVHPYLVQTLKSWCYWKSISYDRNRGVGEKEQAKADFFRDERWSRKRYQQATIEEWAQNFRSGNVAAPKW